MNLDRIITWGEMARGLGVILILGAIGALVAWLPWAVQILMAVIGVVVTAFALSFVWFTLKDKQQARERKRRMQAEERPRMEGVHGVYELTDFDIQQDAIRKHRRATMKAMAAKRGWN